MKSVSAMSKNCSCPASCLKNNNDRGISKNNELIEEYCLDNVDDIINSIEESGKFKAPRTRIRNKKSSINSDLMPISETGHSEDVVKSKQNALWPNWRRNNGQSSWNRNASGVNPLDVGDSCCCQCHKTCNQHDVDQRDVDGKTGGRYIYDPGIEEFILDDNELSATRFYSPTVLNLNYDWSSNKQRMNVNKTQAKSVKSVSIIDTLSELVSDTFDQNIEQVVRENGSKSSNKNQRVSSSSGMQKVKDVKNRSKKNKQKLTTNKRLSSSLPQLNIPTSEEVEDDEKEVWNERAKDSKRNEFKSSKNVPSEIVSPQKEKTYRDVRCKDLRSSVVGHIVDDVSSVRNVQSSRHDRKKEDSRSRSGRSRITRRLSSFERAHTPDWLAQIFDVAKRGRLQELKCLLEGMDGTLIMNLSDRHGNNLLHICCYYNHLNCLKWLISISPQNCQQALTDENKSGLTPVVIATKKGRLQCVEYLVTKTISQRQLYPEDGHRSLLHHAAKYGQVKVVEWLTNLMTKNGQKIDNVDENGCTPLHLAARYGNNSAIKFLAMHGADLNEKDDRGYRAYDHAVQHQQSDCAEYILSLETSLSFASDIISFENQVESLKAENSEMKSCCKETFLLMKKLIKERDQFSEQFRVIRGGLYHLNQLLSEDSSELQDAVGDDDDKRLSSATGIPLGEVKNLVESINSNFVNSQLNSPGSEDYAQRVQLLEDRWRRARLRKHSRTFNDVTKPLDVLRHQQTQIMLKSAAKKSSMEIGVDSSSDTTLSSPHSDDSESSCVDETVHSFSEPNFVSNVPNKKYTHQISSLPDSSSSGRSKIKDHRKSTGGIYPAFITGELAAAVRQSRGANRKYRQSKHDMSSRRTVFGDVKLKNDNHYLLKAEGQTCSVLEVLEPSSGEENNEQQSFLVQGDATVLTQHNVSMKLRNKLFSVPREIPTERYNCSRKVNSTHAVTSRDSNIVKNVDSLLDYGKSRSLNRSYAPDVQHRNHKRHPDDSASTRDEQRRRRSPRSLLNRCAKSDIEDLDGTDFDDIDAMNLFESTRFSEPDLIKETKSVAKMNNNCYQRECGEVKNETVDEMPDSLLTNMDRLSVSVSVASTTNVQVHFPSTPSTSDSSVNSAGVVLDSSSSINSPHKKKGFMLKFQTLKKRWPSRHKFAANKKSQEITAEDFKETYMRLVGDSKECNAKGFESSSSTADDRSECDRLSSAPRQRESVCSASSTSSKMETNPNPVHISRRTSSDRLSTEGHQHSSIMLPSTSMEKPVGKFINDATKQEQSQDVCSLLKRPPLPDVPHMHSSSGVPSDDVPPPLFPGNAHNICASNNIDDMEPSSKKDEVSSEISMRSSLDGHRLLRTSLQSSECNKSDLMSRPASSASRSNFSPQLVTATVETVKAASAAVGFPLCKSSSMSTDLLSPDSSTAGRLSPAPSEISKTESALSPPSDVSKTESTRHLNQLEKIEETKQAANAELMIKDNASDMLVESFCKDDSIDQNAGIEDQNVDRENDNVATAKRVRIKKSEKPWYEVSDDEDMLSPKRYEMVVTAAMSSSSEDEHVNVARIEHNVVITA